MMTPAASWNGVWRRLWSAPRPQPGPATHLFEAVAVGGAIKTSEVQTVRLPASGTSHHDHLVAGLQRLGGHADVREFAPVVELDPPLLRGAARLAHLERDEGMRIDELECVTTPSTRTSRRLSYMPEIE